MSWLTRSMSMGRGIAPDRAAWLLPLATLGLALVLAAFHSVGYWAAEADFYSNYAVQARRLLHGEAYTYLHNPPGYPGLIALLSLVTGDFFTAGKLLSAFAAAGLVWISNDLIARLFSRRVALAASLLLALMILPYSYVAGTDVVGAVLMLLPMWLVLRAEPGGRLIWFGAGILAGLAYLVRSNAIFVLGALIVVAAFPSSRPSAKRSAIAAGALLVGFILGVLPWLAANWQMNGSPFASTGHLQVAAHFFHPRGDDLGTSLTEMAPQFGSMTDVLLYDPARLVKAYTRGLWENAQQLLLGSLLFPAYLFAGAGLLLYCAGLERKRMQLLLWGLLGYLLLSLVGFHRRYYIFLYPLLALWVVLPFFMSDMLKTAYGSVATARVRRVLLGAFLALLLGLVAIQTVRDIRADLAAAPVHVLQVAAELAERAGPQDIVISRKPHVAYYAGLQARFPLAESVTEFREAAEEISAHYLVYSDYEASLWPPLSEFSNPDSVAPHGFRLVYRHTPTNTLLYEIEPLRETAP